MLDKFTLLLMAFLYTVQAGWAQEGFRQDYFRAPLDIDMYLSGNFGELRSNHFHSGIDIKTQGITGHRVYAAAEGYISRIKIEAAGYGNTLYITHPAGYTTVYAHLDRFRKDIARYVRDKQYSNQQHALNIFPGKEEWPVEKGELVAFAGSSGYSFGPHLHFEIRDASNQEPMNVLLFGFDIQDKVAPRIFSLYTYPGNKNSIVNHSPEKSRLEVIGENAKYRLKATDTLTANGLAGFGLEAFDYLNGASNRCGIYRIKMMVDDELKYEWRMERFPFSKARFVNSYIDYDEKVRNDKLVQKAFVDPNNTLGLYEFVENRGMLDFSEPRSYQVRFELDDAYENRSELNFFVQGGIPEHLPELMTGENNHGQEFTCSAANEFSREDIILLIPRGALYTDLEFKYARAEPAAGFFSPIHFLHEAYTPLHLACELSIRPVGLPDHLKDKALIGYIDENEEISPTDGEWKNDMLSAQIREFGRYAILVDTTAPEIVPLDLDGSGAPVETESIRFRVKDDLSGIRSYEGYIDNEWVLFEYDAKNDLVFYRFDPDRLIQEMDHELELYIIDNKENIAYYYAEFYW